MNATALYLEPGRIGSLTLRNRLVRASTSETMAAHVYTHHIWSRLAST